ncbi:MAG: hypothetical protein AAB368_06470, partial [bacterium]
MEAGSVTVLESAQLAPTQVTCARLSSRIPSGAPMSPEPGSNASPLPQSMVSWKVIAELGAFVVGLAPPGRVYGRWRGGPG